MGFWGLLETEKPSFFKHQILQPCTNYWPYWQYFTLWNCNSYLIPGTSTEAPSINWDISLQWHFCDLKHHITREGIKLAWRNMLKCHLQKSHDWHGCTTHAMRTHSRQLMTGYCCLLYKSFMTHAMRTHNRQLMTGYCCLLYKSFMWSSWSFSWRLCSDIWRISSVILLTFSWTRHKIRSPLVTLYDSLT